MTLQLHQQGLSVSVIAQRTGIDRKTVRKYIGQKVVAPSYKPRQPKSGATAPFESCLRQRVAAWPELTSARLLREMRGQGYQGGKTVLYDVLRTMRPPPAPMFETRFETSAGEQARVGFAGFKVCPGNAQAVHRVWLFAMVLGHSRYLWARFNLHQHLPTVLRCNIKPLPTSAGRQGKSSATA